ncbi:MAG: hypothetical protein HY983_02910 [Candidatus Magasanikbacteria bacterium]|nr:hypothetical protein [Candidatus Magasanikbacteria bacterium]
MVTIPFYSVLFVYGFFLLTFTTFALFNIGHLVRTGTFTLASFFVTFLFLSATAIILWFTWNLLSGVDWTMPVPIWNAEWLRNFFSPNQLVI